MLREQQAPQATILAVAGGDAEFWEQARAQAIRDRDEIARAKLAEREARRAALAEQDALHREILQGELQVLDLLSLQRELRRAARRERRGRAVAEPEPEPETRGRAEAAAEQPEEEEAPRAAEAQMLKTRPTDPAAPGAPVATRRAPASDLEAALASADKASESTRARANESTRASCYPSYLSSNFPHFVDLANMCADVLLVLTTLCIKGTSLFLRF